MKLNYFLLAFGLILAHQRAAAVDSETLVMRENAPRVVLDRLIYEAGELVTGRVSFLEEKDVSDAILHLVFATERSGDLEVLALKATGDKRVYVTDGVLKVAAIAGEVAQADEVLELSGGEIFTAFLAYRQSSRTEKPGEDALAADWGMLAEENSGSGKVAVMPEAVLTADEMTPGLPALGTLFVEGMPGPVQVGSGHLLFHPESEAQLEAFKARTGAKVERVLGVAGPPPQQLDVSKGVWLLMALDPDPAKIAFLPQLRKLVGEEKTLTASNEETLAMVATAMELWCEGYLVGLDPRLQLQGNLYSPEGLATYAVGEGESRRDVFERIDAYGNLGSRDLNPLNVSHPVFGVRESWALLAMFDFDERAIPVGVIDSGFAPNPDFKTGHPLYAERNLSNNTSGIGSAQTPQEVGNSFFGDKTWHGNGTVTTISGVLGNYFGDAGIGGQTAVPKLYHMGLASFAFGFGTAIVQAVNDGCSVINISAGYPCRILSVLGNDNICSEAGRLAFSAKLGVAVRAAAAAACGAAPILDGIFPGLGSAVCASAIASAETVAFGFLATVFLGETRGPVETAVAFATSRGVPIIASAGNNLSGGGVDEPLASLVDLENSNIDDWQIIPAVIPDVIAVGAADHTGSDRAQGGYSFHANIHFWGDSVDIWGPQESQYWAPEQGSVDPALVAVGDHIRRVFGGTSNAAPYVTGVVANLMAIDPSLDPRTAPPATLAGIPGRVRDLLVSTAYQSGQPNFPDDPEDVTYYEWDGDTEMWEEAEVPAELAANMARRRNMIHPWGAVQQAAANVGLVDYVGLGYQADLGDHDAAPDTGAPDGVLEPSLTTFPFHLTDEISRGDVDFYYLRYPNTGVIYQYRIEVTMPQREVPWPLLINGRPGGLVTEGGDERTLSWRTPELWSVGAEPGAFPLRLSGNLGGDSPYKMAVSRTAVAPPAEDVYDLGVASNDALATAVNLSGWENVPTDFGLEVDAYEICVEDLTFHRPDDVDVFRIEFPDPPLAIPSGCSGLDPWVTVRIEPPTPGMGLRIISRSGGTETLIARGTGDRRIRVDCREYLGRLPLYVVVESPSGAVFRDYALKVRWSEPSEELADRLATIREAWAGGRGIPDFERFFPPVVPWLRVSPGELPAELVNPNPVFGQALGQDGRYLASRLFLFEIPKGQSGGEFLAQVGVEQSLRMEIVGLDGKVLAVSGTPDLGFQAPKALTGDVYSVRVSLQGWNPGVFLLRLSGHSPGDPITLYLSESLVPDGSLSIEMLTSQGQGGAVPLSPLQGFAEGGTSAFSAAFSGAVPGDIELDRAVVFRFQAEAGVAYRAEADLGDGLWRTTGAPFLLPNGGEYTGFVSLPRMGKLRIHRQGSAETMVPPMQDGANRLILWSEPGMRYQMRMSEDLDQYQDLGGPFQGDGLVREWFFPPAASPEGRLFFDLMHLPITP